MVVEFVLIRFFGEFTSLGFVITTIVEAFIFIPKSTWEFDIYDGITYLLLGFGIQDNGFAPVASSFGDKVADQGTIFTKIDLG